jgi:3-dehydroquinate dehydratase type I
MICISISSLEEIKGIPEQEVELIELRLDLIGLEPELVYSRVSAGWKTIATCRPGPFGEATRKAWLKASMDLGATYIDLEIESDADYLRELKGHAKNKGVQVIISYHNFEETPGGDVLVRQLKTCFEKGGDIAKVTTLVNSREDVLRLLSIFNLPGRKVVLGMGSMGRIIRVMAPYLGAEFTFASAGRGVETAPGQLDYRQLIELYKVIDET